MVLVGVVEVDVGFGLVDEGEDSERGVGMAVRGEGTDRSEFGLALVEVSKETVVAFSVGLLTTIVVGCIVTS